ncbi:MAG TPA: hypothetical protein PKK15_12325 [Kouleothrix sp.]|uniref:hypothetical protein n=1 Tax=Kouleothrix sp. TaxID=2779161 RepID=UPI002C79E1F1|nr:hypothetical protein [Kouleothrix sp.]
MLKLFAGLGPLDARTIGRDALLRWVLALPLLIILPMRLVLPAVLARIGAALGADLLPLYTPIASAALLLLTPVLYGMIIGFLLLDQRDDQTLVALQVTPLPAARYLAYRLATPTVASAAAALVALPLAGLANPRPEALPLAALAAAPLAPLTALALACFAANKVQGLALMKAGSVLLMAPLGGLFVGAGWRHMLGVLPTYWPAAIYWAFAAGDPQAWLFVALALAYQAALVWLLARRFAQVLRRGI